MSEHKATLVVLISGSGSNLQAIIDAVSSGQINATIKAVISNRPGVKGLERAEQAGIHQTVLDHTEFETRDDYDHALQALMDSFAPDLVILAGFMRILTPEFTGHYAGRMLNIHPSLLPKYRGLHTHQRAIDAGDHTHGLSIHFVTAELDGGPVVLQAEVPIDESDDADSLAAKVLVQEHIAYPLVVQWFVNQRIQWSETGVVFDGQTLQQPLKLHDIKE